MTRTLIPRHRSCRRIRASAGKPGDSPRNHPVPSPSRSPHPPALPGPASLSLHMSPSSSSCSLASALPGRAPPPRCSSTSFQPQSASGPRPPCCGPSGRSMHLARGLEKPRSATAGGGSQRPISCAERPARNSFQQLPPIANICLSLVPLAQAPLQPGAVGTGGDPLTPTQAHTAH